MTPLALRAYAQATVDLILHDLTDRPYLRQAWEESLTHKTQEEIRARWAAAIVEIFSAVPVVHFEAHVGDANGLRVKSLCNGEGRRTGVFDDVTCETCIAMVGEPPLIPRLSAEALAKEPVERIRDACRQVEHNWDVLEAECKRRAERI